jgi:glucose/arabinose dehydrogenase
MAVGAGWTITVMAGAATFLLAAGARAQQGQALFEQRCAVCHGERGEGGQGPALAGVWGRQAGTARFGYSPALRAAGFTWDAAHLDRYLADPAAAVPGTSMPLQTPAPEERQALIAFLQTLHPETAAPGTPSPTAPSAAPSPVVGPLLTGAAAFGDWRTDAPGVRRLIRPSDEPPPYASRSASNAPEVVPRPSAAMPKAPPGFKVTLFAQGLQGPRLLRTAPNGDIFVAESDTGRIRVLRAPDGAPHVQTDTVFASGLRGPFGLAFYPAGPNPRFLYIGLNNQVIRFPYQPGDTTARGKPEVVVAELARTSGGHVTRDVAFAPDGSRMFVSVGSGSNVAERIGRAPPGGLQAWQAQTALGAAWGSETARADVLSFTPDGGDKRVFATGIRNCVGLAVQPATGDLWCSTNERDGLGDDVPPDYVTRVRPSGFYGWPWYYIGDHEDPRHRGERPDLAGKMIEPDVLIQSHSASMQMTFYTGQAFPRTYWGDAFAAEHGSWNRGKRTGYKVIRIHLENGRPAGSYEDFLTGFVVSDDEVWGRPVGVTVAHDGALLVSEDANGTIWRVAHEGEP